MIKFSKYKPDGLQAIVVCGVLLLNILVQGAAATPLTLKTENAEITTTTEQPTIANICPESESIRPCWCSDQEVVCGGSYVNQESVNRLMRELRTINQVAEDQIFFTTKWLFISQTSMTSLDLTPLLNSNFARININYNSKLTRIHGPLSNSPLNPDFASISTNFLRLSDNSLTDAGLATCLYYFSPSLETLDLSYNQIQGPSAIHGEKSPKSEAEFVEFLPGISNFINLKSLYLQETGIKRLEKAPFKALGSLTYLKFSCVGEVGEDAFLMDEDDTNSASERTIYIQSCKKLSDDNFVANHGLQRWRGKTNLHPQDDSFEFLSQEKWEPFLQANETNKMDLRNNLFVCDQRMKWLRDGRESYEGRVLYVDCTNDPGHDIFTTSLVIGTDDNDLM